MLRSAVRASSVLRPLAAVRPVVAVRVLRPVVAVTTRVNARALSGDHHEEDYGKNLGIAPDYHGVHIEPETSAEEADEVRLAHWRPYDMLHYDPRVLKRLYSIGFALIFGGFYLSVSHAMSGKAGGTISRLIVPPPMDEELSALDDDLPYDTPATSAPAKATAGH